MSLKRNFNFYLKRVHQKKKKKRFYKLTLENLSSLFVKSYFFFLVTSQIVPPIFAYYYQLYSNQMSHFYPRHFVSKYSIFFSMNGERIIKEKLRKQEKRNNQVFFLRISYINIFVFKSVKIKRQSGKYSFLQKLIFF